MKQINQYRKDINLHVNDYWEANIIRIFKYNKINFKYEKQEFQIRLNDNNIDKLDLFILDVDGLFGIKNCYIIVKDILSKELKEKIINFKICYPEINLQLIVSEIVKDIENISYIELKNKYKFLIPLWEDKLQNANNKPDLYIKQWKIGKRELKRKHKKFFDLNGQKIKTGELWKSPSKVGLHGRPKDKNGKFIDIFEIRDENNKTIEQNENWGAILARIGQIIKDNVFKYYNTENKMSIWCRSKKSGEWWKIVEYDAIKNYWNL